MRVLNHEVDWIVLAIVLVAVLALVYEVWAVESGVDDWLGYALSKVPVISSQGSSSTFTGDDDSTFSGLQWLADDL